MKTLTLLLSLLLAAPVQAADPTSRAAQREALVMLRKGCAIKKFVGLFEVWVYDPAGNLVAVFDIRRGR